MNDQSRYQRGLAKLAEVDGKAGEEVVAPLGDLGRYIVEFVLLETSTAVLNSA